MENIIKETLLTNYNAYMEEQKKEIDDWIARWEKEGTPATRNDISNIQFKLFGHPESVASQTEEIGINSGLLNESYRVTLYEAGLLHDVGRPVAFKIAKSQNDFTLKTMTGFEDHGQLGKFLLNENDHRLLRRLVPETRKYDTLFSETVGYHTNNTNPNYQRTLDEMTNLFRNYDIHEVMNDATINDLISAYVAFVKDADSLELIDKWANRVTRFRMSGEASDKMCPDIWDLFIHWDRIEMAKWKETKREDGVIAWNSNMGYLLRLGLILRNHSLVATLKTIRDRAYIEKAYHAALDSAETSDNMKTELGVNKYYIDAATAYTQLGLDNLIACAEENGSLILTSEIRERAKQKTLGEWQKQYPNDYHDFR